MMLEPEDLPKLSNHVLVIARRLNLLPDGINSLTSRSQYRKFNDDQQAAVHLFADFIRNAVFGDLDLAIEAYRLVNDKVSEKDLRAIAMLTQEDVTARYKLYAHMQELRCLFQKS